MLVYPRSVALSVTSTLIGFSAGHFTRETPPAIPISTPAIKVFTQPVSAKALAPPTPVLTRFAEPCPPSPPPAARAASLPNFLAPAAGPAPARAASPSLLSSFRLAGLGPNGGWRLGRVVPASLPAAIGLQSGDELISINSFRLADPEQALLAYARLRSADRLSLRLSRHGAPTEIVYFIR
jgi:hypothetical protein